MRCWVALRLAIKIVPHTFFHNNKPDFISEYRWGYTIFFFNLVPFLIYLWLSCPNLFPLMSLSLHLFLWFLLKISKFSLGGTKKSWLKKKGVACKELLLYLSLPVIVHLLQDNSSYWRGWPSPPWLPTTPCSRRPIWSEKRGRQLKSHKWST